VLCLRYARKWETLTVDNLTAALAARAIKETSLLTEHRRSISVLTMQSASTSGILPPQKAPDPAGIHTGYERVPQKLHQTILGRTHQAGFNRLSW